MVAKTSWHRYGTKLGHCHPMCINLRPRCPLQPVVGSVKVFASVSNLRCPPLGHSEYPPFARRLFLAITSSIKPEIGKISQRCQKWTEQRATMPLAGGRRTLLCRGRTVRAVATVSRWLPLKTSLCLLFLSGFYVLTPEKLFSIFIIKKL